MVFLYSDSSMQAIAITERIGASLSLVGCSFMILTFLFSRRFRRPVNRIMFYASIGNLIYTIPGFIALDGLNAGPESGICQAQAFIVQAALPADAMWNFCMALNVYFTVFKGNDMKELHKKERWYLVINSVPPVVLALALYFVNDPTRGRIYGAAGIWCWITPQWEFLRIVACYGIAWLCIILSFTIYIAAGYRIRRERQNLFKPSLENGRFGTHLTSLDIVASTTVQTTIAENPRPSAPLSPSIASLKNSAAYRSLSCGKPPSQLRYQVHISSRAHQVEQMLYSDPVRKYMKSCILFFVSLLITWVPSSVNRLWALTHPNETAPFGIAYMAALVLQLTGFWNSLVYITMSRQACKELIQTDLLPWLSRKNKLPPQQSRPRSPLIWRPNEGEAPPSRQSTETVISERNIGVHEPRGSGSQVIMLEKPDHSWRSHGR